MRAVLDQGAGQHHGCEVDLLSCVQRADRAQVFAGRVDVWADGAAEDDVPDAVRRAWLTRAELAAISICERTGRCLEA